LDPSDAPKWDGAGFAVSYDEKVIGEIEKSVVNSNYYLFISQGLVLCSL